MTCRYNPVKLQLWWGIADSRSPPNTYSCYHAKLGCSGSNGTRVRTEICRKVGPRSYRNWNGSIRYRWIPISGLISYRFRQKWWFLLKFAKVSYPCVLIGHAEVLSLAFCDGGRVQKTTMMPLPDWKSWTIRTTVSTQYQRWTNGRTDGQKW